MSQGPATSIGRLAADVGVSTRTIRYYEELGILPEPDRTEGGTRRYGPEYRFYLRGAMALKEIGFTLDEIRVVGRYALGLPLTPGEGEAAQRAVAERRSALEDKIRVLDRLRAVLAERGVDVPGPGGPARAGDGLGDIFARDGTPDPGVEGRRKKS